MKKTTYTRPSAKLANAFSTILNEWIPEKIFEVNLRNMEPSYNGCCATHDFCDPNQAMIDAFKKLYGKEPSIHNKMHNSVINESWNLAKANKFKQF